MKRIALISFAALAALVSCQKEEFVNEPQAGNSPVFTASIATDETKTTLSDDSPAKILWESSDKITITDGTHTAVYKLSAGEGTKSGTFIKDSGDDLDNPGTYTATYGAAPANYQVYSAAGSVPLYMTAPETSSTDGLVFTAQCGVLRVTLSDASHDIMRVEVSDASGNTYRVTSSKAVDIDSETKFYITLPAGTYTSLNIYDDNFQMVSKTGIELAVTTGHVKPAANTSALTFADCTTKGFKEINSVVRAIVQLWADGPFWSETNIGAETPEAYGQYFAWGYPTGQTPTGTSFTTAFNTTNYSNIDMATLDATHDMATVNWGTGWSVPTTSQFMTLINFDESNKCSMSYITVGTAGIRVTGTTTGYTSNSIFLPAAGYGDDTNLASEGESGGYWSSEQYIGSMAYPLLISSELTTLFFKDKYLGYSVRPVYAPASSILLPGEFSVSATKKVKFTKGNLWWNGSEWKIESNQTDYPTSWSTDHVGHFYWSKTATVAYAESYSDSGASTENAFFCGEANPMTVDGQSGLYALSSAEWTYLLSSSGRGDGDSKFKKGVTVNGVANCLVIVPDDYSGTIASSYDAAAWAAAEPAGLVCLPAAGYRDGSTLCDTFGYYWTATPYGSEYAYAYSLAFDGSNAYPSYLYYRVAGCSVRLVYSEAPSAPEYPEAPELASVKIGDVWWAPVNCGYEPATTGYAGYPYGKLYQWGRKYGQGNDGDATTPTISTYWRGQNGNEDSNTFYTRCSSGATYSGDWIAIGSNTYWNTGTESAPTKTKYDPCPTGWRVPTYAELNALKANKSSWTTNTVGGVSQNGYWFSGSTTYSESVPRVFLPAASCRNSYSGDASSRGSYGYYWSSSVSGGNAKYLCFGNGFTEMISTSRANGYSVRCVQE